MEMERYIKRIGSLANDALDSNPFIGKNELVFMILLNDILSGELRMGETIQQNCIAHALNCSRSPIREALTRLVEDGFCIKTSNGAYKVKKVTIEEYINLSEFRISLEVGAVRLAARNATSEDLLEMKKAVNLLKDAISHRKNERDVIRADHELHRAICYASKNQFFIESFEAIKSRMLYIQSAVLSESNHHNMLMKHKQIVEAIGERDEAVAQECMRSHLSFYTKNMHRLQQN